HRADEVVDLLSAEEILLDLVFDDAVPGFLDREARQGFGVRRRRDGHCVHDRVYTSLAELGEREPRHPGAARQRAGLGDGGQIAVRLGGVSWFNHRDGPQPLRTRRTRRKKRFGPQCPPCPPWW